MPNVPHTNDGSSYLDAEDDLNIAEYISTLWEGRWLILSMAFAITAGGVTYAMLATPIFRSDIMIQVEAPDASTKSLVGELAPLLGNSTATTAELEILRSRSVIGGAVSLLNLNIDAQPVYFPGFGKWLAKRNSASLDSEGAIAKPFFGLGKYAWGGEKLKLALFSAPLGPANIGRWTLRAKTASEYVLLNGDDEIVLEGVVGKTARHGELSLKVDELSARPGTEFRIVLVSPLQAITDLQDQLVVQEKGKQSGVIIASLDGDNPQRISLILNTVANGYVQQNINRKSAEAEKTLKFLDEQLPALKQELDASEARYNKYRTQYGTVDFTEEAKIILQQSVDGASKLVDLQQKRLELIQRFTPLHPSVIAVDNQIGEIQKQINGIRSGIGKLPGTQQDALRLLRDVTVNNELYTGLLNNAQQLRVLKAGKIGNVRLVDFAVPGEIPLKPKRSIVVLSSLVFGLFVGVALTFARKAFLGGVESSDDIERATGLPVLASIPLSLEQQKLEDRAHKQKTGLHLLAQFSPQDLTVESLRSLRTALQFAMLEASNNLVMISGPSPGVGKSFVSSNLAAVLAASGKRVLLVDADLRRGHLHEFFGKTRSPGLSTVVGDQTSFAEALHREVVPGLDFLSTGSNVPNPAELLGSSIFENLMKQFGAEYDLVLIDTPPVLAVTDAGIVGKFAGTTLLNLRHGRHAMAEIQEAIKRLNLAGVELKGVLLNAIPRRSLGYGKYRYDGAYYNYDYSKPRS